MFHAWVWASYILHFSWCHNYTLYCSPFGVYTLWIWMIWWYRIHQWVWRGVRRRINHFCLERKCFFFLHYFLNEPKESSNAALGEGWETLRVDRLRRCSLSGSCKGRNGTGGTRERVPPEPYLALSLSYKNGGIGIKTNESRANYKWK